MSIKKITWNQLMNNLDECEYLFSDEETEGKKSTKDIVTEIDNLVDSFINEDGDYLQTPLTDLVNYLEQNVLVKGNSGIWNKMPLYTSSYIENDRRFLYLLKSKIREYLVFYKKILTDEGVQRHLVYDKEYENDGNSDNLERGINSNTPQNSALYDSEHPESDAKFDQAIADYASTIDKNKAHTTSHTEGSSGTTVSGTTWEEGKKNIQMMFFNELKDYIFSIPERIYSFYSLETIPAPELTKKFIEHLYEVRDMLLNE